MRSSQPGSSCSTEHRALRLLPLRNQIAPLGNGSAILSRPCAFQDRLVTGSPTWALVVDQHVAQPSVAQRVGGEALS